MSIKIKLNTFVRGKGIWKHKTSLLRDKEYVDTINKKIEEVKAQYAALVYNQNNIHHIENDILQFTINVQLFLETLLMEIRGKSIAYSSHKSKLRRNK